MTVNQDLSKLTTGLRKYLNKRKGNIVLRKLLEKGKSENDGYYTHHKKNKKEHRLWSLLKQHNRGIGFLWKELFLFFPGRLFG